MQSFLWSTIHGKSKRLSWRGHVVRMVFDAEICWSQQRGCPCIYYIHIYIHNCSLHILTPLMLCVLILYISGRTYSLKSTPNDRFFEKLFTAILFTLRIFARNLMIGNRRRNTFRISFWCMAWKSNLGFSSNKPTHYLLDHGDFLRSYYNK